MSSQQSFSIGLIDAFAYNIFKSSVSVSGLRCVRENETKKMIMMMMKKKKTIHTQNSQRTKYCACAAASIIAAKTKNYNHKNKHKKETERERKNARNRYNCMPIAKIVFTININKTKSGFLCLKIKR